MTAVIRDKKKWFSEWWITGEVNFLALKQGKRVNHILCYRKDFCHIQEMTPCLRPVFLKLTRMVNMRQRSVYTHHVQYGIFTNRPLPLSHSLRWSQIQLHTKKCCSNNIDKQTFQSFLSFTFTEWTKENILNNKSCWQVNIYLALTSSKGHKLMTK